MRSFKQIHASYLATDGFLAQSERNVRGHAAKGRWSNLRFYNDQAYYVMLFAQLEQFVDAQCTKLIDVKKRSPVWKNRRLWDSTDADRLQFMRKVALLTEKGAATYNKIDQYYDLRCDIAHGTPLAPGAIVILVAVQEFRQFARDLKQ
jgi:hypothetical protein